MKDTRTSWAQEADAKREAWNEIDRLKKRIAELEYHKQQMIELAMNHGCDSITQLAVKCQKQQERIAELEKDLADANECLTIAYMQGFSDCKAKQLGDKL